MSIFDTILQNMPGTPDDVTNLAAKIGIDPGLAEQAIAALGKAHQAPGDTVETASAATGLPTDKLNEIVSAIGGEGSLSQYASILDRDGDGNPLNDVLGMAKGLFGKE